MITANKGALDIKGTNLELFIELDEIFKYAIKEQPEIMQVIINNRGEDLLNADTQKEIVALLDVLLKDIIKDEKEGGEIDD